MQLHSLPKTCRTALVAPLAILAVSCGGAAPAASPSTASVPPAVSAAASKPAVSAAASVSAKPAASTAASGAASAKPAASGAASAKPAASGAASASAKPAASGAAAAEKPAGTVYSFDAQDYSFAGPASIQGGLVTIQLKNMGKEEHHMQLLKLNDNATMDQVTGAFASGNPDNVFKFVSALGGPGAIDPNGNSQVTENLPAGQYVLACFISGPDGVPHAAKGMVKPLTVTAPASPQASPSVSAGATVTLKDFTFDGPTSFNAGPLTIKVDNSGPQIHEMNVLKLGQGKQVQDVLSFFSSLPQPPASVSATGAVSSSGASGSVTIGAASAKPAGGPPPFQGVGGMNGLSQGVSGWTSVTLTPGDYAFICNVPDPASGKPHWALGMIKGFSVK